MLHILPYWKWEKKELISAFVKIFRNTHITQALNSINLKMITETYEIIASLSKWGILWSFIFSFIFYDHIGWNSSFLVLSLQWMVTSWKPLYMVIVLNEILFKQYFHTQKCLSVIKRFTIFDRKRMCKPFMMLITYMWSTWPFS